MSLQDVLIPKKYKNGKLLYAQDLDAWRTVVQDAFATVNSNLTQIIKDGFGLSYELDNDGDSNLSQSLQAQINLLSAGGTPITGTTSDSFTIDTDGFPAVLSTTSLTALRTFTFPDVTGTVMVRDGSGNVLPQGVYAFNTDVTIGGNGSVTGTLGVTGATTLSSTLGVTGATTLSSTLGVTGATTLSSTLAVTGATTLSSTLGVTGATTLSSTLGVTGATTLSSTLAVTGNATFDSTTMFVDATNDRVGMGLTNPVYRLHVRDQGGNDPAVLEYNGDSGTTYLNLYRSKGSYAAKTIVTNSDTFGIRARGYDGANYQNIAAITFSVDGTPGVGDMPGRVGLWTSPDGSASMVEHFRINQAGTVSIKSGGKLCLDGLDGLGDTYWIESSPNVASLFRGGTEQVRFSSGINNFLAGNIYIASTNAFYWDGGGDTYTLHPSSNVLDDYVGGVLQFRRTASKGSFSDTLTVGHNPSDGSDSGSFTPSLIINAGEATRISLIDFRALGVQKGLMSYQHNATAANETFTFKVAGITSAFYIDKNGTKITSGTGISPSLFINAPTTSLDSNLSFMAGGVEKGVISYNHNATANLATLDFSVGGSAPLSIGASLLAVTGALTVSSTVGITSVLTASGGFICESGSFCSYVTAAAGNKGVIDISGSTSTGNMSGIKFSTTGGTLSQAFNFAASYYSTGGAAGTLYAKIPTLTAAGTKYMYLYDS